MEGGAPAAEMEAAEEPEGAALEMQVAAMASAPTGTSSRAATCAVASASDRTPRASARALARW